MRTNLFRKAAFGLALASALLLTGLSALAGDNVPLRAVQLTVYYDVDGNYKIDEEEKYMIDRLSDGRFVVDSVHVEEYTPVCGHVEHNAYTVSSRIHNECEALCQRSGFENAHIVFNEFIEDWETLENVLRRSDNPVIATARAAFLKAFEWERDHSRRKTLLKEADPEAWTALLEESRRGSCRVVFTAWYRKVASGR